MGITGRYRRAHNVVHSPSSAMKERADKFSLSRDTQNRLLVRTRVETPHLYKDRALEHVQSDTMSVKSPLIDRKHTRTPANEGNGLGMCE